MKLSKKIIAVAAAILFVGSITSCNTHKAYGCPGKDYSPYKAKRYGNIEQPQQTPKDFKMITADKIG